MNNFMSVFGTEQYFPQLSIDCVVFGYEEKSLKVLMAKFKFGKNIWILPGGYIKQNENIENAAQRILFDRTGLEKIYLEQFRVFGSENRVEKSSVKDEIYDTLTEKFCKADADWILSRFISIGFYALVDINKVNLKVGEFDHFLTWVEVDKIPNMAYDHEEIIEKGLESLRRDLDQKLLGFNLLPETFTMKELLELYEAVYNKEFSMNNFQKKMLDLKILERLEKKFTGAQNKAPYLYRLVESNHI
jgi:8-oxo-dGTP diphosphatase